MGIGVAPRLLLFRVIKQQRIDAANIRPLKQQTLYLVAQSMWCVPIIIVPMRYNTTPGLLTRQVALCPNRRLRIQANVANALVCWYQVTNGISPIVNNEQLFVGVVLEQ